jgi:hypothetical protein
VDARDAVARVSIDDPAGQKHPRSEIDRRGAGDDRRARVVLDKGAEVVEDGREANHRGTKRRRQPRRLTAEFLHPVEVGARRRRFGFEAGAKVPVDRVADAQRERHTDEHRDEPHGPQDGGRSGDAADGISPYAHRT